MVSRILKNGKELFLSRQSSILGAATILMATVATSRLLGLLRARLLAAYFTPEEAAVYFVAFRLPDMIYNLLIFGALAVAFIPVFSDVLTKEGKQKAFDFASQLLSAGLLVFAAVSFIALLFLRPISELIAIGFNSSEIELMTSLTRILFLSQLVFVVAGLLTSLLQTFRHYLIPAIAGILYNLGIIIGIVTLTPFFGIYGPVYGVILGSLLYLLIQIPIAMSVGFRYKFTLHFWTPGVKRVLRLMGPRTMAIAGEQLRTTFNLSVSSSISTLSVTVYSFAQQLYLVPVGLFIATMAQATLPVLSTENALKQDDSFIKTLITSLHQVLFMVLPAAAILVVLRIPVVRLAFGASQFTWEATVLTGKTVAMLALGMMAEAVVVLFVRAFYALHDTRTPVKVTLLALAIDVVCSIVSVFVLKLPVWVLGLSSTIGGYISAILLFHLLNRRMKGLYSPHFYIPFLRMAVAAFVMAICLYVPIKLLDQLVFDTTRTVNLMILTGIAATCGVVMYLFLTWVFRVREAFMILHYVRGLISRGKGARIDIGVTESVDEIGGNK
jgi:putative peptidoglycan lipid II flippase